MPIQIGVSQSQPNNHGNFEANSDDFSDAPTRDQGDAGIGDCGSGESVNWKAGLKSV